MPRKQLRDPDTGSRKQPFIMVFLSGIILFGLFVFLGATFPYRSAFFLYLSLPFGILAPVAFLWMNFRPNLWAKMIVAISLSGLCAIIAYRAFSFLLPGISWLFAILIFGMTILGYVLPVINLGLFDFVHTELSWFPQTRIGKLILKFALVGLPVVGALGGAIGLLTRRLSGGPVILEIILGPLCWMLAVSIPFSSPEPYSITPWEKFAREDRNANKGAKL
jgi:hypothetical protein